MAKVRIHVSPLKCFRISALILFFYFPKRNKPTAQFAIRREYSAEREENSNKFSRKYDDYSFQKNEA